MQVSKEKRDLDLTDYKIGARLNLDIYDDIGEIIDRDFISQFEGALNAYEAYIAVPIVEGMYYAVRIGWKVTVYMQDGNNFYRFFARVVERVKEDARALLLIQRTSEIDVAQRRQYYRFKVAVPFRYKLDGDAGEPQPPYLGSYTSDISAAGMCFYSKEELAIGTFMDFEISIEGKLIRAIGKVVRCIQKRDPKEDGAWIYELGVLFSDISERSRETIFKFIFDEERRRRRKGVA